MIERQPELAKWSATNGGMPPGLDNPLGAPALYIFQGNVDTLYRIHGTPDDWSIGRTVSSGCVRMLNHYVIDLYNRIPSGSPILVLGNPPISMRPPTTSVAPAKATLSVALPAPSEKLSAIVSQPEHRWQWPWPRRNSVQTLLPASQVG